MKTLERKGFIFERIVAFLAINLSKVAANRACVFFAHQPELPKDVQQLRKINKKL